MVHVIDRRFKAFHERLRGSGSLCVCVCVTCIKHMKHVDTLCCFTTHGLSIVDDWGAQMHVKGGKAWESLDPQRTMSGHYVKRAWHSLRHRPLRSVFCFVFYSKYLTAMRAVSVKLKRQAKSVKVKKKKMCVNFTVMLLCSLTTVTTVCLCSRFQCSHPLILQQHRYVCGQLWFRVN